jgi:hypothetical protein
LKRYDADGTRLTDCCGAYSKVSEDDGGLFCRACRRGVGPGEGDGSEQRDGTPPSPHDMLVIERGNLDALLTTLRDLAAECDRHASHAISDHRPYFKTMAARARAALAKAGDR